MFYIGGFAFISSFYWTLHQKHGCFLQGPLVSLGPSRRNSCLNTLFERRCVHENQSRANERPRPAHTVALVYYSYLMLIGGKVGKIGLYVAFVDTDKSRRRENPRWKYGQARCLRGKQPKDTVLHVDNKFILWRYVKASCVFSYGIDLVVCTDYKLLLLYHIISGNFV